MLSSTIKQFAALRYSTRKSFQRFLNVQIDEKYIKITEKQNCTLKYPQIWLRDNCQCPECFHQTSKSRAIDWDRFDVDKVAVRTIWIDNDKKFINIEWNDEHKSSYSLPWLKEREFTEENREKYLNTFYRPRQTYWCREDFSKICKEFEFKDVLHNDEALRNWLESLAEFGVVMIKNALENDEQTVRKIADRVGFIRRTYYGEEFIVRAKPGATNYAYLSTPLPLHTDLPYYEYKPGVNLLHCLVQSISKGGSNLLADGFFIAERIKNEHPENFKILTETLVDWNDIVQEDNGYPYHSIFRSPVITLDNGGNYKRINRSVPQRDSHFSVQLEKVIPWYTAYDSFVKALRQDAVEFKTKPGDVLTFSNIRCIHGRTGYDDGTQNVRYIVGAYLDWDIIFARLRVLIMKNK